MKSRVADVKKKSLPWGGIRKILCGVTVIILILALCPMMFAQAEEMTVTITEPPVDTQEGMFLTKSMPTVGDAKIAVFLIEFPDYKNENDHATVDFYEDIYFNGCSLNTWGTEDSVADFFYKESGGKLNIGGRVFDWYTAENNREYYNDKKNALIIEVAEYYMEQGVDFSEFDGNGDGVIDAITYHFAGEYEESISDDPWYHGVMYGGSGGSGEIGDLKFRNIVQLFECATDKEADMFSVICHELTHTMGMPDLYGTAELAMFPVFDLMGGNVAYMNPYFKLLLGWVDSVRVITGDVDDVRIESSESSNDFVLVTDDFNGFFDEFYIVSYRYFGNETRPTILHVDARLNESGSAFLYSNLTYDPSPDVENAHPDDSAEVSKHLFMEELSADPDFDYVINDDFLDEKRFFGEDSALGPNSVPSSDTHDGEYTGIRMDSFLTYDGYMTFNVSFVEDTEAPAVTTDLKDMEFKELITLTFSEFIYEGDTWDSVAVTDIEGNALDATVKIPEYPHHHIEITFNDETYKNGYKLIFPEGSVKDSSGNGMEALTITTSPDDYMFPLDETALPDAGTAPNGQEYRRNNAWADFFYHENDFVVVSILGYSGDGYDSAVEIMRLDYNGNVLSQHVVENPFVNGYVSTVREMGDGSFVFFCLADARQNVDIMFCVDSEGNLRWANEDYLNTDTYFYGYTSITRGDGMVFRLMTYMTGEFDSYYVYVDPKTGETSKIEDISNRQIFNLSGNRLFRVRGAGTTYWEILDGETFEVLANNMFEGDDLSNDYTIRELHEKKDGTILVSATVGADYTVFLLDAELNVIKTVVVDEDSGSGIYCIGDDGFAYIKLTMTVDHDDSHYRVYRYDKNLNLIWKEDIICNFIRYFKTPTGELLAYKSMFSPDRKCYIVSYESEDSRKTTHDHVIKYAEDREATCDIQGFGAHWYCEGCGIKYSDAAGTTPITDISDYVTPAHGHTEVTIPYVPASCVTVGLTEGKKCSVCNKIIVAQREIGTWPDHAFDIWVTVEEATCNEDGLKQRRCVGGCGTVETEVIPKTENHPYANGVLVPATCVSDGYSSVTCSYCGEVKTTLLPMDENAHTYDSWTIEKEATCYEEGLLSATCSSCGESATEVIPTEAAHAYGSWVVTDGSDCISGGTKIRTCNICGATRTEEFAATGYHTYGLWSTVKEETCAEEGLMMQSCSVCGHQNTKVIPVSTKSHTFSQDWNITKKPTCGKSGSKSKVCDCGAETDEEVISATGEHVYGDWVVMDEPTCRRDGLDIRYCQGCTKSESRVTSVEAGTHTLREWTVSKNATCLMEGKETRRCECGEIAQTRIIPILTEHTLLDYWYVYDAPTCAEEGEERRECACGKEYETRAIEKSDKHIMGKWETTKEPICHDGEQVRSCPCGQESETRVLPMKVDHRFGKWAVSGRNENGEIVETRICSACKTEETRVSTSIDVETDKVYEVDKDKINGIIGDNKGEYAPDKDTDNGSDTDGGSSKLRQLGTFGIAAVVIGAVAVIGVTGTVAVVGGVAAMFIFRKRRMLKRLKNSKK